MIPYNNAACWNFCNVFHKFPPISVSLRDAIRLPRPKSMASILFLAGGKIDGASNFP